MRHKLEYALVASVRALARVLPDRGVAAVGTAVGLTFWALDAAHRRLSVRGSERVGEQHDAIEAAGRQ